MGVLRVVRVAVDVFDIVGIMSVVTMCVVSCVDVGVDHTGIGVVVVVVDVGSYVVVVVIVCVLCMLPVVVELLLRCVRVL